MIKVLLDGSAYVVGFFTETGIFQHGEACEKERLVELVNAFPDRQVYFETTDEFLFDEIYFMLPHLRGTCPIKITRSLNIEKELEYWLLRKRSAKKRSVSELICLISIGIILGVLLLLPVSKEYKSTVLAISEVKIDNYSSPDPVVTKTLDLSSLYTFVQYSYNAVDVTSISFVNGKVTMDFTSDKVFLDKNQMELLTDTTLTRLDTIKSDNDSILYNYKLEGSYDRTGTR